MRCIQCRVQCKDKAYELPDEDREGIKLSNLLSSPPPVLGFSAHQLDFQSLILL